jgi:hypothetical protein
MRRIFSLIVVALVMAAMMLVMAMPVFAVPNEKSKAACGKEGKSGLIRSTENEPSATGNAGVNNSRNASPNSAFNKSAAEGKFFFECF